MAEINSELAANVKMAKTKRMRFVFVAKGGSDGALVLAKSKVPPALITAAKKKSGGTQVLQGACFGEDGKLVFEMAKEPPATMEAALKKVIQRDAGISQHCLCRLGTDPDLLDGDSPESPTGSTPPIPAQDGVESLAAVWKARDAAIAPHLKAALSAGGEASAQFAVDYKAARALAAAKKFQEAIARLDALSAALRSASASTASAEETGETQSEDGSDKAAEFRGRLMKAVVSIKQANADWLKNNQDQFKAIDGHLKAQDAAQYAPMIERLEQIAEQLQGEKSQPQSTGGRKLSLVKLGKARLEWPGVLRQSIAGIHRVQEALKNEFGSDVSQQSQLADAMKRLDQIAGDFTGELGEKLDDVLNAKDDSQRPAAVKAARDVVKKFTQRIMGNELLRAIDGNRLVPDARITQPMLAKLHEIVMALGK